MARDRSRELAKDPGWTAYAALKASISFTRHRMPQCSRLSAKLKWHALTGNEDSIGANFSRSARHVFDVIIR